MKTDTLTRYMEQLVDRIQKSNPLLAGNKYRIYVCRTTVPNAYSRAEGVIFVNLDLIARLETEADMAFVLCHELSHDAKKHVLNGIKSSMHLFHDKEFQKELKKAEDSEYNTVRNTETVLTRFLAKRTEHSRGNELEADSLGFIFFTNAGYNPADAPATLLKLDLFDEDFYKENIDYKKFLSFPDYPFNKEWLVDNTSEDIGGNLEEVFEIPDSLKTHPDCDMRAATLEEVIKNKNLKSVDAKNVGNYAYFRARAQFESIEYLLGEEEYGFALYNALQMLKEYPENKYLHSAASLCLLEIYTAQKNHKFSRVAALPDEEYSEAYNEYLIFLNNLNSTQMKEIATRYFTLHVSGQKSPFAGYVGTIAASLDKPKAEYSGLVLSYDKNYKDAYYKKLLDKKFNSKP
jgi:predicted Zn-dependent protease